jgi:hypothetical protein
VDAAPSAVPSTIVLYRLFRGIQGPQATPEDFFSNQRKGLKPRPIERQNPREYEALSHWDTLEKMRHVCRTWPKIGNYIAELHIPENGPIELKQEGDPGHWNAWGEPEAFLQYVTTVHPVEPTEAE